MGRALGINALMSLGFEAAYGTTPANGFRRMPFVSTTLGAEQGLLADDLAGTGRDPLMPGRDIINAGGDVVVPLDLRNIGVWLRLLLGDPTTTADEDVYTHLFESGAASLPSVSVEIGHPEVPSYTMNTGLSANSLAIRMQRSGLAQATFALIGQNEVPPVGASVAGAPTELEMVRFNQFQGSVTRDGVALGNVVSADLTYSNNLETVEVIRADGAIGGVDPGKAAFNASLTVRFDSLDLLDQAVAGDDCALEFGFAIGADATLVLTVPSVYLPRPKRPITGPGGVQATFTCQGARPAAGEAMFTATLVNDVESY
ncbi:phage tail tube protein [Ancylobacter mangrovi]|uniref:phage tail tube protein n=1 Tax=Ancylobacter mangrovi TaxID=2972472 RepID=UPI0021624A06|nr:phage tail tube protein [Ancylobacter mangrovi]MCS0501380.1 phage tail tube protein [Ancylobacter mangrovi]